MKDKERGAASSISSTEKQFDQRLPGMIFIQKEQFEEAVVDQREVAPTLIERNTGTGVSPVSIGLWLLGIGPLLILAILVALISLTTPVFLKPGNISNILAQTAVIA